jgi:tetratricopeptide (TPR) repeat protein
VGQTKEAIQLLKHALQIAEVDGNLPEQTKISGSLGHVYHLALNLEAAENFYRASLELAIKIGLKGEEGQTLGNIGLLLIQRRKYGEAAEYLKASRGIAKALGNLSGEGKTLGALGLSYHAQGEFKTALEYYEAALEIAHRIGDSEMTVHDYMSMSNVYKTIGDDVTANRLLAEGRNAAKGLPHLETKVEQMAQAYDLPMGDFWTPAGSDALAFTASTDAATNSLIHSFVVAFGPRLQRCLQFRNVLLGLDGAYGILAWAAVFFHSANPQPPAAHWALLVLAAAGVGLGFFCAAALPRVLQERAAVTEFALYFMILTGRAWSVLSFLLKVSAAGFLFVAGGLIWIWLST